jgi:transposase
LGNDTGLAAEIEKLRQGLAERDALIESLRALNASLEGKNAALESSLVGHANEIELMRRKLFGPRSERGGTSELQLALGPLLADQSALQAQLNALVRKAEAAAQAPAAPADKPPRKPPTGRRDLSLSALPQVVVDIADPDLAARGKLIDWEISRQLMHQNACWKVLVRRLAKYELPATPAVDEAPASTTVLGVLAPQTLFPKSLLHTSAIAWIAVEKFGLGVPHYRLEQHLESCGVPLDRGTMGRYMEELGSVLGATVVKAMLDDARTCSVLSTDATGAAIQPAARAGPTRRACDKGHFFALIPDRDHVIFEYTEEHSSAVVARLFAGFKGFLQTDASSVYDVLERPPPSADAPIVLVGCWAHYLERRVIRSELRFERSEPSRAHSRLRITTGPTRRRGSSRGWASVASACSPPCSA